MKQNLFSKTAETTIQIYQNSKRTSTIWGFSESLANSSYPSARLGFKPREVIASLQRTDKQLQRYRLNRN